MTKRQNILNNIKTVLQSISGIGSVELEKGNLPDIDTVAYPCIFIYSDSETRIESPIGSERWSWHIVAEVWTKTNNLEDLLKDIHSKMYEDVRRGGYALDTKRIATEFFFVDPSKGIKGMAITFEVNYQHALGDMTGG